MVGWHAYVAGRIEGGNAMPEGNKTMRCPITRVLGIVGSFSRNLAGIFLLNPLLTQLLKNNWTTWYFDGKEGTLANRRSKKVERSKYARTLEEPINERGALELVWSWLRNRFLLFYFPPSPSSVQIQTNERTKWVSEFKIAKFNATSVWRDPERSRRPEYRWECEGAHSAAQFMAEAECLPLSSDPSETTSAKLHCTPPPRSNLAIRNTMQWERRSGTTDTWLWSRLPCLPCSASACIGLGKSPLCRDVWAVLVM